MVTKSAPKKRSARSRKNRQTGPRGTAEFSSDAASWATGSAERASALGRANQGSLSSDLTAMMPAAVEQMVAINAVPIMEVGLVAPAAERIPTVVAGMS